MIKSKRYDPKNTKEVLGKIQYHEQIKVAATENSTSIGEDNRKVLIIHTGGTIGMFRDQKGKFQPQKDRFKKFLETYPYFSDENETYFIGKDDFTITPETIFKKKIWYKLYELQNLIDSTNMNIERLNRILKTIKTNYDNFDAFIILHGTDTMSYTASALSFMIDNLKKTIIITGSQGISIQTKYQQEKHATMQLITYFVPLLQQILVLFDNILMRGNRTTKTSASSFNSFNSPNFYPIGTLGLRIEIKWELVRACHPDRQTSFTELKAQVGLLKLTPFGGPVLQNAKYLVIESYGVGNIPTDGPVFEWLKENSKAEPSKRSIIVNISQVYQSVILNLYATGQMAVDLGLIPGGDMTCQAAVAKLSYLATLGRNKQQIAQEMVRNMRGQLTDLEDRQTLKKESYVLSCSTMLQKNFASQSQRFREILQYTVYPKLVAQRCSRAALSHLIELGLDINYRFPDGGTLLHHYLSEKARHGVDCTYLKFLLQNKIDVNIMDNNNSSALFYALQNEHLVEAKLIKEHPYCATVSTSNSRFFRAIRNHEFSLLQLMYQSGDKFKYLNEENRNAISYSTITNDREAFDFFRDNLDIEGDESYLQNEDIYGKNALEYIKFRKWNINEDVEQQDEAKLNSQRSDN